MKLHRKMTIQRQRSRAEKRYRWAERKWRSMGMEAPEKALRVLDIPYEFIWTERGGVKWTGIGDGEPCNKTR